MDQAKISRKRRWIFTAIMVAGFYLMSLGVRMEGKIKGIWDWDYFVFIGSIILIAGIFWGLAVHFKSLQN